MSKLKTLPSKTTTDKANRKNFERWSASLSETQRKRFEGTIHRFLFWLSAKNLLINQTTRSTVKRFIVECYDKVNKANGHLAFYSFYTWAQSKGVVTENFMRVDERLELVYNEAMSEGTTLSAPHRAEDPVSRQIDTEFSTSAVVSAINKAVVTIVGAIERQTAALVAASHGPAPELIPEILPPARVDVTGYLESLPEHERDAAEMAIDRFRTFVRVSLDKVSTEAAQAFFAALAGSSSTRTFDTTLRHIENLYGMGGPMKGIIIERPAAGATAES